MNPNTSFSFLEKGERTTVVTGRFIASGWVPVPSVTSGFRKLAPRFLARGLVSVQFGASGFRGVSRRFPAIGWVLGEQTCIARGSPVHTKLACLEVRIPLGVRQADGLLRARHDLADEDIQGRVCSIQVPTKASVCPQDAELFQGDALALADERTWRLPASGWAVFE